MSRGVLVWDFDGTLATRPGNWTGALCEVVVNRYPDLGMTPDRLRPHLQRGFPWHQPEIVRGPCSEDEWWDHLLPVLAGALRSATPLGESQARQLAGDVRALYIDPRSWQLFDDVLPALRQLSGRGWRHVLLSNHVPELSRLTDALGLSHLLVAVYSSGRTGVIRLEAAFPRSLADECRGLLWASLGLDPVDPSTWRRSRARLTTESFKRILALRADPLALLD